MLVEQVIQYLCFIIERKTDVFDQSLFLKRKGKIPNAKTIESVCAGIATVVQQIEIKLACTGALQ